MIPVLLDQGLPIGAAAILRRDGWDAVHVSELGLATADDSRDDLQHGAMVTVTTSSVRIHRIPIE